MLGTKESSQEECNVRKAVGYIEKWDIFSNLKKLVFKSYL